MNILDKIYQHKREEVALMKKASSRSRLQKLPHFDRETLSLADAVQSSASGVIAEIKKASPSAGRIARNFNPAQIARGYEKAGAAGISVLTDQLFFQGSYKDLLQVREAVALPLLRKDFIIDEIQLEEARGMGADAILLIAACLEPSHCRQLAVAAQKLSLEVLLEVHGLDELKTHFSEEINLVGVNNRNLKDFSVSLNQSEQLISEIPSSVARISESGINTAAEAKRLKLAGYDGLLIGTTFMKEATPAEACSAFIREMNSSIKISAA